MRLFAAAEVPQERLESVQQAVAPLQEKLPGARWTARSSWHVTVKFFGEVADARVEDLVRDIARVARSAVPVDSRLLDVGAFPSLRRARVLWVGVDDPESRLDALARQLSRVSDQPAETRSLHPHLTLARFKVPSSVEEVVERFRPFDFDQSGFRIDRLRLFRSHLSAGGARYEVLETFEFSPGLSL
ncbi:MAG: RNA 2',3'-cyclic phosphodiesterase [Actinomycetota bacterium]